MSRCLVIINPVSGGGRAIQYAMELQWQLSTLFDHMEIKFTTKAGDATRFAKYATVNGYDSVFCMGGGLPKAAVLPNSDLYQSAQLTICREPSAFRWSRWLP